VIENWVAKIAKYGLKASNIYNLYQLLLWISVKLKHKIAMVNAVAIDVYYNLLDYYIYANGIIWFMDLDHFALLDFN
jgi:hypothetical protein